MIGGGVIDLMTPTERAVFVRALARTALRTALNETAPASQFNSLPGGPSPAVGELELAGGRPQEEQRIREGSAAVGVVAPTAAV